MTEYQNSSFASDGALRGALATFESGDEPTALEQLATIATGQGSEAPAAARWYDLIAGPDARVAAGVPAASEIDPRSFDAILEAAGSRALDAPLVEPLPRVVNSSSAITTWLTERYGVSTGTGHLGEDDTAELVQLLADAQERSLARAVLLERLDDVTSDPHAVIDTGIRAAALSLPDAGLIAAMRILGGMGSTARQGTPLELERIAYPAPWPELVVAASEEFGVPPLLLLALVRQESAFEPDVSSPAGAIGLTQVIPPTGVEIARILGEPWEGPISLTDPATSLRYGAAYLATQLDAFDGNVFAALAAYNAGPGNARRWLDVQVWPGADGYVQAIDFEETHRYVEGVVEQYAWYRYAYGLSTVPAIR
ncbi:MAG: lytic transglycosylase domain-containing protein [Chloroflexi bacterium]|nr:lytic transglycosylase domain-containing protein [Chloroflexota bacterium]MDA1145935.1 lytic transglycosylase domain-containing protein [Chloroflexota bacterium]